MASKRFCSELQQEVPKLVEEKIITKQQGSTILKRYEYGEGNESHSITSILATFGAILVALGILTLVALNWKDINAVVRVLMLLAATLGAYWLGYELREHRNFPKVGSSIIFLGAILVGISIVLIAQIYNLSSTNANWLLLWAAVIIPTAYVLVSTSSLALGLGVFTVWFATWFASFSNTSMWWAQDAVSRIFEIWPLTVVIFLGVGVLYWAIGMLHTRHATTRAHANTYKYLGAFLILFTTYFLTFRWLHNSFWSASRFSELPTTLFILVWSTVGLSLILLVYATSLATKSNNATLDKRESRIAWWMVIGIIVVAILGAVSVMYPQVQPDNRYLYNTNYQQPLFTPFSLVMNVLFLALLIGTATIGIMTANRYLVNLATLFFAIDIFTRYIEFFWDRLSGGFFFIITGLILIALAVSLENLRRRMMSAIPTSTAARAVNTAKKSAKSARGSR